MSATSEMILNQSWCTDCICLQCVRLTDFIEIAFLLAENKTKNQNQGVHFLTVLVFQTFLLKTSNRHYFVTLGVRGFSLNSRELLTMPFNYTTLETHNIQIQKHLDPKQTVHNETGYSAFLFGLEEMKINLK